MQTTIRAELAAAIQKLNAEYHRLSPQGQATVEIVADDALDRVLLANDRDQGLTAIADWRDQQLAAIRRAT